MILMLAPTPNMTFGGAPSNATYVSDQFALIKVTTNSVADQTYLQGAGCFTLSPFGGWGTFGFTLLADLYAADTGSLYPGAIGFPEHVMATVLNDGANTGSWAKTGGSSGAGNWTQVSTLTIANLAESVAAAQAAASEAAGAVPAITEAKIDALAAIADTAVTPFATISDYVTKRAGVTNLFHFADATNGMAISPDGHAFGQDMVGSDFMPVRPGEKICASRATSFRGDSETYGWGFYDKAKAAIGGAPGTAAFVSVTVPTGAYYTRCAFDTALTPVKAAVYAADATNAQSLVTLQKMASAMSRRPKAGENLFVPDRASQGYIGINGDIGGMSGGPFMLSDYMSVKPDDTITTNQRNDITGDGTYGWAFFDIEETFVAGIPGGAEFVAVTVPANCYYARTSWNVDGAPLGRDVKVWTGPTRPGRLGNKKWVHYGDSLSANYNGVFQRYVASALGLTMPSQDAWGGRQMRGIFERYQTSSPVPQGDPVNGISSGAVLPTVATAWVSRQAVYPNQPAPYTSGTTLTQDLAGVDLVTIMLGTNDFTYASSIGTPADAKDPAGSYSAMVKWAIEGILIANPAARLIMVGPVHNAQSGNPMAAISEAQKAVCKLYSVPFIDLYSESGVNELTRTTYVEPDGIHLTRKGQVDILSRMFCGAFDRFYG